MDLPFMESISPGKVGGPQVPVPIGACAVFLMEINRTERLFALELTESSARRADFSWDRKDYEDL